MYANVIVDISHEQLDKIFQYRVPDALLSEIDAGVMVNIPFGKGNRIITGYVIELTEKAEFDADRIKSIESVVPNRTKAVFRMIKLAEWLKRHYGGTMNQALKTVIPVKEKIRQREKKRVVLKVSSEEAALYAAEAAKKNAAARSRLLTALADEPEIDYDRVKTELKISPQTVKALENSGLVEIHAEQLYRNPIHAWIKSECESPQGNIELNSAQQEITDVFKRDYDAGKRQTYLIHGVTGSGKTLCYIEMIEHVVSKGRQAVMLIPEIALTYQTVKRFYDRFGERVTVLNSRMSKGERYDQFLRAMRGEISVIIGPRSALFTPFPDIGLIVVDEEHENAYKSEQTPRYHARETAVHIAETMNASVVLGSATPSIEAYYRAKSGQYRLFTLEKRASGMALPTVYTVDLREELKAGNRSIFSRKLSDMIYDRLKKHQQTMLFLNKRGYAGFISCRACGHVMKCPHCDISLTSHRNGKLVCHYCGYESPAVTICPSCGSKYISGFRAGTQQVEELLHKMFPGVRTLRMDMDTTSGKEGHEKILSAFADHEADILVGTQMIVKGHDFSDVTLVGVLAADMSLYSGDYRASERTFQLLVQAAGRAGRAGIPGEVVIQTYTPDNYSITAAAKQDYESFYEEEIAFRKMLGYPPVFHLLGVSFSSGNREELEAACDDIREHARELHTADVVVSGPVAPQVYKLNDIYTQVLYSKCGDYESLAAFKDKIEAYVRENSLYRSVSVQFDFD